MPKQNGADRSVPHNLEAERALIGSIMLDNQTVNIALDNIGKDDFYSEANRITYEKIVLLNDKARPIDDVTICEELGRDGLLEKAGGAAYISNLTNGVPIGTLASMTEYCRIVKEKSTLRRIINTSNVVISRVMEGADDSEAIIEVAQSEFTDIAAGRVTKGWKTVKEIVTQSFGTIEAIFERGKQVTGIPSGLVDLDNLTTGFQPGELILIAARPSLGKTALATQIAIYAALREEKKAGMFSLEMSGEALVTRMLCAEARIDSHKLRTGFSQREDWNRMTPALGRLSSAPIFIDDSTGLTTSQIRAKARRLKNEHGLDLLIIDYLQLIRSSRKFENRNREITEISMGLKECAKELKVPLIALSQLSRAPEQQGGKRSTSRRPILSDLRESGSLEQDADVVLFIWRDKKAEKEDADNGIDPASASSTMLIIGKNRNGPIGDVPVVFLRPFAKFENQAHETGGFED